MEVEDVASIVDRLTAVDTKAATTAGDLATAMSRTANSANISGVSMDRLIGYIAAVQEVTQRSAETVGESFKTLFARMGNIKLGNYLDDDGEDLSDVETVLKSFGIALRDSEGDFRNYMDVLDELHEKWQSFSLVDKRAISNAFAGTRQQENFLTLMENYGKALEYAGVAADSAGTAMQKFAAYEGSIESKAATFVAAMESLTLDTIDTDFVKDLIDAGTEVVRLTEKLGLLKAALASLGVGATLKGVSMISSGFKNVRQDILNLGSAVNTLKNLDNVSSLSGATIKKLGQLTKGLNDNQLKLVLTSNELNAAQMRAILTASGLTKKEAQQKLETLGLAGAEETATGATWSLSTAMTGLGASIKAAFATNPIGLAMLAVGAAVAVVSSLSSAWDEVNQKAEEARQAMSDAADAANDQRNSLAELVGEYKSLASAGDFDQSSRETAKSIQQRITELVGEQAANLDLVNGKLDDQISKLNNIAHATALESAGALETKYLDAQSQYLAGIKARGSGTNFLGVIEAEGTINQLLRQIGYVNQAWENVSGAVDFGYTVTGKNTEEVLALYKELQQVFLSSDKWQKTADSYIGTDSQTILNQIQAKIDLYDGIVQEYRTSTENYLKNQAIIDVYDDLKTVTIDSKEALDNYIGRLRDNADYSQQYKSILIQTAQDAFPQFTASISDAADEVGLYSAKLSSLKDTITDLKSAYSAADAAQNDMADGGGLSPETIEKLAAAEENYLSYLRDENGVIKLNTQAWLDNADAKIKNDMAEIRKEITALEERNNVLKESVKYYEQQRQAGNDGGIWSAKIAEAAAEIRENSAAIQDNQGKLAVYGSLYGSITGNLDAYTAALNGFSAVASSIDAVSNSFQTLADLQAQVANGFTLSLEKALEFAKTYPEILNSAQVSADGQIELNEGVVTAFIQGKKAELDAQIDSKIAQLEADKAILEAKTKAAEAQLELMKQTGDAEGMISKEIASYRINLSNALTQSLIDMGVEESKAYALATSAMAEDEEEFAKVAKECFQNISDNSAKSAYAMAHNIYVNSQNASLSLADVARQAHETAKAIAAAGKGEQSGSGTSTFRGADGKASSGVNLDFYKGTFRGSEYEYQANTVDLNDFVSQIHLDVSSYQDAIKQIDGQIATLRALKNLPLNSFKSVTKGGSTSEVEEYIASIDEFREAVERLRQAQENAAAVEQRIKDSDNLKEKILLQRQLINVYQQEQEALAALSSQRSNTITSGVTALEKLGFAVEYNAEANELWISNLEHLNELTADSKGEYKTLQEATNALRKDTESLINTLTDLNTANRDGAADWQKLGGSIKDAHGEISSILTEIVDKASDAVDEIQDVYNALHSAADEFAEYGGYLPIDTIQSIIKVGQEYLSYLMDENGALVINEERIRAVIAAKTQQMAIESALSYVEALRIANEENDVVTLNHLLYATEEATDATWGLVYANLKLSGLEGEQYEAALHVVNSLRSLADSAVQSIGQTANSLTDELQNMKSGLDDIVQYVMDMLRWRTQEEIKGIEAAKDAYSEEIAKVKELNRAKQEEANYEKSKVKTLKEIAKLQARIDALSLDDSRQAQAERAKLLEELAELQEDLNETQSDKAIEATEDALDKMEDAYHKEKDKEIEILEDSISSTEKLYRSAIDYIQSNFGTLRDELIQYNYDVGNSLESELVSAWDDAYAAAQRYGDFVSALQNIDMDISTSQSGSGSNLQVGNTTYDFSYSTEDDIHATIKQMYANMVEHGGSGSSTSAARKAFLSNRNLELGQHLNDIGVSAYRSTDAEDWGTWYTDRSKTEKLFDKYRKYIYHKGGIAGNTETLKDNEVFAKLEKGESILTGQMWNNLVSIVDQNNQIKQLIKHFETQRDWIKSPVLTDTVKATGKTVNNVVNNNSHPVEIQMGDIVIQGNASQETVQKHEKVTRDMVNQILRIMKRGY